MSIVASLLSVALFLAFGSAGAQKILFNPAMSRAADRLRLSKKVYQRFGLLELLGGVGLLIGVAGQRASTLGVVNEVAAGLLVVMMSFSLWRHLRVGDAAKYFTPPLVFGLLALAELLLRAL